jgi:hypothetical protein
MIFIQNKYTKWYNNIISNAQTRSLPENTYIEKHHIIPRSLGGSNDHTNLVKLTAREHFVCHLLLTKMTAGRLRYKMSKALTMIMSIRRVGERNNYSITSRWYEHARKLASVVRADYWTDERRKAQSIRTANYFATVDKSTDEYKRRGAGARQYNLNKVWTEKAISSRLANCLKNAAARKGKKNPEQSARMKGKKQTAESNTKRSIALKGRKTSNGMLGKKHKEESNRKRAESMKKIPDKLCPYCNRSFQFASYGRWHGDNCKLKPQR